MLPFSGQPTDEQNERRRLTLIARAVAGALENIMPAQQAARAAGIGATEQVSGHYDENGEWHDYLRCGHPLNSGGCAP